MGDIVVVFRAGAAKASINFRTQDYTIVYMQIMISLFGPMPMEHVGIVLVLPDSIAQ